MHSKTIPDEVVFNFCTKILPDFHKIMKNLEELNKDLSPNDFAMHLMELGRGQMCEVEDPSEQEVGFISDYVASLRLDNANEAFFVAYAGGCIMGLVTAKEVPVEDLSRALSLIENFAQKEFASAD